jgi:hypothetical protein
VLPSFRLAVDSRDWREAAIIVLSRFEVYIHAIRAGEVRPEESELFDLLNAVLVDSDTESVNGLD